MSWHGIDVEEYQESGSDESFSRDGAMNLVRKFKLPAKDRLAFATHVFQSGQDGLGPIQYPGIQNARAETCKFSLFPPGDHHPDTPPVLGNIEEQIMLHTNVIATVTYTPLEIEKDADDDLPDGTYATYRMSWTGEFQEIPSRSMYWENTSIKVADDAHPTILIPRTQHIVTWNRVPNPPWFAISKCRGKVNQDIFKIPATRMQLYPETLLFMGAEPEVTLNTTGELMWSLQYTFEEKSVQGLAYEPVTLAGYPEGEGPPPPVADPINVLPTLTVYGHNHIWRDDTGRWEKPEGNTSDTDVKSNMHLLEDFSELFKFAFYPA